MVFSFSIFWLVIVVAVAIIVPVAMFIYSNKD